MKKIIIVSVFFIMAAFPLATMAVPTESFTYRPGNSPYDMFDLDHSRYYTWGIDLTSKGYLLGTPITEATLTFSNITNFDNNPNVLYIHLLNDATVGLVAGTDNQGQYDYSFHDQFASQGILIEAWEDKNGSTQTNNLTYRFSSYTPPGGAAGDLLTALNNYASNGVIGFGVDPDCHFWNDGVKFTICTHTIPAPGAVFLGGIGVSIVGWLRRRRTL